jgi:hypothetical protein
MRSIRDNRNTQNVTPNSLDVSAYTVDNTPVAVLDAAENYTSTFRITLDDEIYVLLPAATWDPTSLTRM